MKLRDIVNRDQIHLENCESEPIHIPGSIQPHGFLLFLEGADFKITFCSSNLEAYCQRLPAAVLGRTFETVFGQEASTQLSSFIAAADFSAGNPIGLQLGPERYSCAVRAQENGWLIDAEPFPDGYQDLPDLYEQTRRFVNNLERTQSMEELCQYVAAETRRLTGYDRVMIYRFDKQYNGEVIAEALDENLEPFLGLHYPHTDIPPQARQLYLSNLMRIITDVSYQPVPILTIDDGSDKNLDLSHSVLRSVSPIHIEYLKNMGVGATLTISLVQNKKLWGLIACHHYSPKNIPHFTRLTTQLQGHFLASQIALRQAAADFTLSQQIAGSLEQVMQHAGHLEAGHLTPLLIPALLELTHATGVAMVFLGKTYLYGDTPASAHIEQLAGLAKKHSKNGVFASSALSGQFPLPPEAAALAAGMLYYKLDDQGNNYILWLRKENRELKIWAGNPAKAIVKDQNGLSPRKSFEQWQEIVSGQSMPWAETAQQAAATLAHSLQKQLSYLMLQTEEKRNRAQSELLRQAYSELEGINWISMHDLQEPLRKIQVFASRLEARSVSDDQCHASADDARRIFTNARRMQNLIKDMQVFARLNTTEMVLEPVLPDALVTEVAFDFSEEFIAQNGHLDISPLPEIKGNPFLLRQLFGNLIANALKFSVADRPLSLKIFAPENAQRLPENKEIEPENYHLIVVQDNGIGFDKAHVDDIFGLFKRLHAREDYEGTGVGLAICRKIMQLHHGMITADAREGEGAAFELWFPKN